METRCTRIKIDSICLFVSLAARHMTRSSMEAANRIKARTSFEENRLTGSKVYGNGFSCRTLNVSGFGLELEAPTAHTQLVINIGAEPFEFRIVNT